MVEFLKDKISSAPQVSVVIAARNEALHVDACLRSILCQTGVIFELIFVDDNSTDATLSIAKSFCEIFDNITVVSNPGRGKCSAFNFGISIARGGYICIFAGDDIMPNDSLAERYNAIKGFPPDTNAICLSKIKSFSEHKKFDGLVIPRRKGQGSLSGVSPLMSRAITFQIFPVPEHLPNEDTWMELAILYLPEIDIVHIDTICCFWRVHGGNSINMSSDFEEFNKKITIRMGALGLFLEQYGNILTLDSRNNLIARVRCESARRQGRFFHILMSGANFLDKLRAISTVNSFFYFLRKGAYRFFSGWGS